MDKDPKNKSPAKPPVTGLEATVAPDPAAELPGTEETMAAPDPSSPISGAEETVLSDSAAPTRPGLRGARRASGVIHALTMEPTSNIPGSDQEDLPALVTVTREHYTEGAEFARGGMGRIVAARDRRLGREVAIKELLVARPDLHVRFERESRITGRLQHPSIVPIYEHGQWPSGEPFYAMKHIKGRPLHDLIGEAKTATDRLALLPKVRAVAEAMAYAHSKRVIHRDLKPQNVLVGDFGETVVIDWGLAKELDGEEDPEVAEAVNADAGEVQGQGAGHEQSGLTMAGAVMGTPAYMPPEQARGEPVDERADVYAVGAILYNCLSGQPPYRGDTSDLVITALLSGPPRALREVRPELPPDLSSIVDKAMASAPEDRYPTAEELAADLRRYEMGQLVGAHRYGGADLLRRWAKRNRLALSLTALFLCVLAVFGIWSVGRIVRESNRAKAQRARAVKASERARIEEAAAKKSAAEATARLAHFYVDEGRRELLAGHPRRGLAYLGEARRLGLRSLALRILLARVARLIQPQLALIVAHAAPVETVAFGLRGRVLFTAGQERVVKRWSVPDGKLLSRCPLAGEAIRFSHDAARLIVGQRQFGDLAVVDSATCQRLCVLKGLASPGAMRTSMSADSARLAAADFHGTVVVWDVRTCRALRTWPGAVPPAPKGPKPAVKPAISVKPAHKPQSPRFFVRSLSPDGKRLALGTPEGAVEIWNVATGDKLVTPTPVKPRRLTAAAFSPDGSQLVTGSGDGLARVWDATTAKLLRQHAGHRLALTTVAFSPDGKRLVTASLDDTVRLWDSQTGRLAAVLKGHSNAVKRVAFSAKGQKLMTMSDDRTVGLWHARTGAYFATFRGHLDHVSAAVFDPAGHRVATAGHDHRAILWNANLNVVRHQVPTKASQVTLSPDGSRILLTDPKGRLWVGSSAPGAKLAPLGAAGPKVLALAFGPKGRRALVSRPNGVTLWDTMGRRPIHRLVGHKERVTAVGFGPRGKRLSTASWDETARLWDAATGKVLHVLAGHDGEVTSVAFSPDHRLVATTSSAGLAHIWDSRTGNQLAIAGVSGSKLVAAHFTPDGRRLVTVSDALRIVTWRSADGAMLASVEAQSSPFSRAKIAAGGRVVLTSGWKSARLWDAKTGKLLNQLGGGRGAISADARRIVTLDPRTSRATLRVVPQARLTDTALNQMIARSPWRLRQRRLIQSAPTPGWSREPPRPPPPPGQPLVDDPAMGLQIKRLPGWGVELSADHYLLERRLGARVRVLVKVFQGETADHTQTPGGPKKFVRRIMKKELRLKYSVTRRWSRFAGRKALVLRGPQVAGQAAIQWIILPRGKHPILLQLTLDGAAWSEPTATKLLREIESALQLQPPWKETPTRRKQGFPFAGDLARVHLPPGWKLKKYGPGAHAEFTAPGPATATGLVRVLGPDGAVWCEKGNRFPTKKPATLSGQKAWLYQCPEDNQEQVFYTVRVGRSLLYVALTDKKTKGLSGPITRFPSLVKLRPQKTK